MSRLGGHDGPEDVDATFAEIVADLRAQGLDDTTSGTGDVADPGSGEGRATAGPPSVWRDSTGDWDATLFAREPVTDDEDEHYVPPEPPPLPKPRKGAAIVLIFFVLGLLLLIAPQLVGLTDTVGLPLGLLALSTGIALVLLRVKQGPPDGSDPDTGAQV